MLLLDGTAVCVGGPRPMQWFFHAVPEPSPGYRIGCGTIEPLFCFHHNTGGFLYGPSRAGRCNPHLAFCDESVLEGEMVRSAEDPAKRVMRKKTKQDRPSEKSVGDALRRVYDDAVREKVPADLLALLSKLD